MRALFLYFKWLFIIMIPLSVIIITLFYMASKPKKTLPVYQPAMVSPELTDPSIQYKKKYHTISDFKLVNQNGDTITEKNYENTVYVADFFFTHCQTICPMMTDNMRFLQENLDKDQKVLLLSHSVTPETDSVAVLRAYARQKGVDDTRWNLVTGDREQIFRLARSSYLVGKDAGNENLIHTENFALIDHRKRIRGYYDGTNRSEMQQLLDDIGLLLEEMEPK